MLPHLFYQIYIYLLEYINSAHVEMKAGPALVGAGPNWEQFRSAQVPSQLAAMSVELGAGPNWEQLVQLA